MEEKLIKKRKRRSRTFTVKTLYRTKFKKWGFKGVLRKVLGDVDGKSFTAHLYGGSGHGKSRLMMEIAKELQPYGKIFINQAESGKSSVFKKLLMDFNIREDANISIGDRLDYKELKEVCLKNRCSFILIDSSDAMKLTVEEWEDLVLTFLNKKSIITIGHADPSGKKPKGTNGKWIEYWSDIKINVFQGSCDIQSRFGADPFYDIPGVFERWQEKLAKRESNKRAAKSGNIQEQVPMVSDHLKQRLQGASPEMNQ